MADRHATGALGETLAVRYLEKQGYLIRDRNVRLPHGELDIVASDHGTLVFVEVKARRHHGMGSPLEAVTPQKAARVVRAAREYLHRTHQSEDQLIRFDVISLLVSEEGATSVELIRDAFQSD